MKWLDDNIDRMRARSQFRNGSSFTSYSRAGSIFNVVVCGLLVVGAVSGGLTGTGFAFVVTALATGMEVMFVRTMFRAFRGDFQDS